MKPSILLRRGGGAAAVRGDGTITVRPARESDDRALVRVAERDSRAVPAAPLLVAEVDGELVAALSLADGAVIADPFRPTAEIVELLGLHARHRARRGPPRLTRETASRGRLGLAGSCA